MLAEKKKSLEKVSFCGDLYPRTCQKEQETHLTDEPRASITWTACAVVPATVKVKLQSRPSL
jgi:hypothetical protein